ncbi:4601_t:CDS:2 [Rhizophagus irregularis]|nr:4601_t:CDS:2 [Rhizophagus irregularis]
MPMDMDATAKTPSTKRRLVIVVIDNEAAVSIMMTAIMKTLILTIDGPLEYVIRTANKTRVRSLEKIQNLPLTVKNLLIKTNIQIIESVSDLNISDFKQPFIIHTDAPGTGLGAVISQIREVEEYYNSWKRQINGDAFSDYSEDNQINIKLKNISLRPYVEGAVKDGLFFYPEYGIAIEMSLNSIWCWLTQAVHGAFTCITYTLPLC